MKTDFERVSVMVNEVLLADKIEQAKKDRLTVLLLEMVDEYRNKAMYDYDRSCQEVLQLLNTNLLTEQAEVEYIGQIIHESIKVISSGTKDTPFINRYVDTLKAMKK
jgi:hypothetical protein